MLCDNDTFKNICLFQNEWDFLIFLAKNWLFSIAVFFEIDLQLQIYASETMKDN